VAKESPEAKRARKAAAKRAARERAARIVAGEIPDYLQRQPNTAAREPRPPQPQHKVVYAPPEPTAKALIPPTDTELQPREREHYADNAPPLWVREDSHAEDD
jgi:hypothetical protein